MSNGHNIQLIEIPEWSDLKSIIDNNSNYKYDHALKDDIQELTVIVRQSEEFAYFTKVKYNTTSYTEYITFYADKATNGINSGIPIIWEYKGSPVVSVEGNIPKMITTEMETDDLLFSILLELKKINIHFEILTDQNIKNSDIREV